MASDAQPSSKQRNGRSHCPDPGIPCRPETQCVVCGDRACSHHYYGVAACHGCKCFFWRSVKANAKYVCRYGGNCAIDINGRNCCRYCRFSRCIQAGMKPEGVGTISFQRLIKTVLDAIGLSSAAAQMVSAFRDRVHEAFYQHCIEESMNATATIRFARLFHLLPKITTLAVQLEEHIQLSHTFCEGDAMDPLLCELLGDIFEGNRLLLQKRPRSSDSTS
ncbi:unnamed protein product [Toxocara canis]|uniref:Nuclear receptor domain-containing protein n=1 Tax=Toxocara canis TaxID=6265 RepID=A0A183TXB2_TOXCA|nr:unnamed protein product [Toxocara canis]